ncbi:hypothetical protein C8Q77DRAFT_1158683 [Trametes polyzona]|nr:hypothetical protein C8Q77DRAFT_1158683 [Trametes polyzona]
MDATNTTTMLLPPIGPAHELTQTFGVLLIGFIFTVSLYGLTFFQTYIYYTRFPHDAKGTKYTVGLLWATDTMITALISHTIYRYMITDFMLPFALLVTTRTFIAEGALSVFLALIVQCYYASRIWTASGRRSMIPSIVIILALAALAFNLASVAKMTNQTLFHQVVSRSVKVTKGISWGLSSGADILIAWSMLWYLRPTANPGMATPEGWYEKVAVYGVNRGTSFAIFQIVALILLLTMPDRQTWILIHWVGSKVYVNSILSMLNFRNSHRGRGVPEEASQNQHARDSDGRSGTFTSRSGFTGEEHIDTSANIHFNVHADSKNAPEPVPVNIELDMIQAAPGVSADSDVGGAEKAEATGGPSKRRSIEVS